METYTSGSKLVSKSDYFILKLSNQAVVVGLSDKITWVYEINVMCRQMWEGEYNFNAAENYNNQTLTITSIDKYLRLTFYK